MAVARDAEEDRLLQLAREGDEAARAELLRIYRPRLRKLVAVRLDERVAARVDASDVVRDAINAAHGRMSDYLSRPRIPFYLWLRGIALDRLVETYRQHIRAQKRTVLREESWKQRISDQSACTLADALAASTLNPSGRVMLAELQDRVRAGLNRLKDNEREVLVLRHLEQLTMQEIATVLGVSRRTAASRHLRAVRQLRRVLGPDLNDGLQ